MSSPIRLDSPCEVPWAEMTQSAHGKHCAQCDRVVHDLTRATEREARGMGALFGTDRFCARLRVGTDGVAVFRGPLVRESRLTIHSLRARVAAAAVGLGAAGCTELPPQSPSPPPPSVVASPTGEVPSPLRSAPPLVVAAAPIDSDHDGVTDDIDKCPDVAGAATDDGCPRRVGIVSSGGIVILESVRFAPAAVAIPKDGERILEAVVEVMRAHPEINAVEVHGHADHTEAGAVKLSRKRADRVVEWLVKKGVEPGRLIPIGDGSDKPVETNATVEGRAKNRRIEFRVIADPASPTST